MLSGTFSYCYADCHNVVIMLSVSMHNVTKEHEIMLSVILLGVSILSVIMMNCYCADCHYFECHNAECHIFLLFC